MEIILGISFITLVVLGIFFWARKNKKDTSTPISPATSLEYHKEFSAYSIGRRLIDVKSSISFLPNGEVKRGVKINGTISESIIGIWNFKEFKSDVHFDVLEQTNTRDTEGPRVGTLAGKEVTWSLMPTHPGFILSDVIIRLSDGNISRNIKLTLAAEAADLRL